jgi:hypothetical protein
MRTFPAGWPDPSEPDQTLPVLYVHLIGASWPPEAGDCPAGYAEVASWQVERQLVGTLLAGQVATPSGFAMATGNCSIAQPAARLAPWKKGSARVAPVDNVELIASFDGPTGDTAFRLGTFRLDPISSTQSAPSLSLEMVEDWVALRRPHSVRQMRFVGGAPIPIDDPESSPYDPARIIEQIVDDAGFSVDVPDFGTEITSIYFPEDVDALTCVQQIVAAHLGAVRSDVESGGLTVLTYEDLSGSAVDPVDTLNVLDKFEDLTWVIDPGEVFDRVEVRFTIPKYLTTADLDNQTGNAFIAIKRAIAVWEATDKTYLNAGAELEYVIDPGSAWSSAYPGVSSNTKSDGSGETNYVLLDDNSVGSLNEVSTGRLLIKLQNSTGVRQWLTVEDGNPSFLNTFWKDVSSDDGATLLSWGADAYTARNPMSVDLGKLIQRRADAQVILDRIVSQVREARPRIESVNIVPDLRRELGDIVWVDFPEEGLHTKAILTKITNGGSAGSLTQVVDLVLLGPRIRDFNEAWDAAIPGATIADFNAKWSGKTIADFNQDPLNV